MAASHEVSCIRKPDRSPDRHIEGIGGVSDSKRWYLTEEQAIAGIKEGKWTFYVSKAGLTANVIIATRSGRE